MPSVTIPTTHHDNTTNTIDTAHTTNTITTPTPATSTHLSHLENTSMLTSSIPISSNSSNPCPSIAPGAATVAPVGKSVVPGRNACQGDTKTDASRPLSVVSSYPRSSTPTDPTRALEKDSGYMMSRWKSHLVHDYQGTCVHACACSFLPSFLPLFFHPPFHLI